MTGTIVNAVCIIAGSLIGSILKKGIGEKYRDALYTALGICAVLLGVNTFVHNMPDSRYPVLFIVSMAAGSVMGTAMGIERLKDLGKKDSEWQTSSSVRPSLADGLTTGCLLYCIGTFSMLGPVMAALHDDHTFLFTNATLDLVSSAVLAATYGIGMVWAAPILFCWQGMFYCIAKMSASAISPELMTELSIIGGILITASGIDLLKLRNCHTLRMLPSLLVPPVFFFAKYVISVFYA
ncbi:MAG: DUF554 domain-containing protein [Bacteroidales bacterium]|nr:DUF554 domain-containing protein [Bacteroidales bacterium]MCM1148298.1 DUF554 domain-containing protein [Bacteroidales bacterium]MCM1206502.1 DUF554 domain-containing protein [Bacillota bacterium]MCM1510389.1 DUF554 domain-containing protein [Clostridium sp.]